MKSLITLLFLALACSTAGCVQISFTFNRNTTTYSGWFGVSPGIDKVLELEPGVTKEKSIWLAHSGGAAVAVHDLKTKTPPDYLILVDPWPLVIDEVLPSKTNLLVIAGRECKTFGRKPIYIGSNSIWDHTIGHLLICLRQDLKEIIKEWLQAQGQLDGGDHTTRVAKR